MKEKYILDTNVFIEPKNSFYPFDFAKTFWNQMESVLVLENVFLIDRVFKELKNYEDDLSAWISKIANINIYPTTTVEILNNYRDVLEYVNSCGLYKPIALRDWSTSNVADPWLIATAKHLGAKIITFEVPAFPTIRQPSRKAKIPDVATAFNVQYANLYSFMRSMDFRL